MAERQSYDSTGFSVRPADNTADLMRMNVNKNYVKSVDNTFDLIRSNMISKNRVDSNSMTSQPGSMTSQMGQKPPMPKPNAASLADIDDPYADPYADPYGGDSSYQPPNFGPPIPKPNTAATTQNISQDSGPYSFPMGQKSMDQGPVLPPMYSKYSVQTTQSFAKSGGDANPPFYSRSTYSASQQTKTSQLSYNYPHK